MNLRPLRRALTFTMFTYLVSFVVLTLYFLFGGKWVAPGSLFLALTYMFIPMTVAIVLQKWVYRESLAKGLLLSRKVNRWYLIAWLLPLAIALLAFVCSFLIPGVTFTPGMEGMIERFASLFTPEQITQMKEQIALAPVHPFWLALVQGLLAGATVNAVAAFGEEAGWRGFLLTNLKHVHFWKASLFIGVVWGFWHAPLILLGHNYPQHPVAGVFMMTIWTVLLTPLMCYVTLRAKSVLAAALFHGSLNGTFGLALLLIRGGSDLTVGVTGLAGFVALALLNLGLFLLLKKKILPQPVFA
ncbi:MAG: CPBP family intramembrane metalloprotease [Candidatus Peribacteraceae bacterium]|nr:CPBP family intramembrane metalloprotease [Candidatus Peribacteraceae bacterium]MDD5074319.1 CPBP family intramembrane metalloprotease [Candidatus Peribacteraceae bacterium]